ncbi:MAG TPA: APC family permease [Thermoanaerobaculia bacterium]|nr:APC family permease [Thermoanaerobaculia bacterium]
MHRTQSVSLLKTLLGRRLATSEAEDVKIGAVRGVPVLGLDALASAAYGPEAALAILIGLGALGLDFIRPITFAILLLLGILYLSYRQTIAAYPNGGGSYAVAKANLGTGAGLCAAAALVLDYILNAAVGISAGVGALVSAFPALHAHTLALCLGILVVIAIVNLRGVRESGIAFGIPTYAFVILFAAILAIGVVKAIAAGGRPVPVVPPPQLAAMTGAAGLWLLLRAFASGCTAMTGVEAVSNGVPLFRDPAVKHAQRTLTAIVAILACFLGGIAYLANAYGIGAMKQEVAGYQSVLSSLIAAIVGRGTLYYMTIGCLLAVLCLSANTSFAGFPRICRSMAEDDFLPHAFASVGRRLVYSIGIIVLTTLAGLLLIVFGGITEHLIPLFAVGAFGAFTFSQAGMVVHWRRVGARKNWWRLAVNAVGAATTAAALLVIVATKFRDGAWITVVVIPALLLLFRSVHAHYRHVERQVARAAELELPDPAPVTVVLPVKSWDNLTEKALRFALALSPDVTAVHVYSDRDECEAFRALWAKNVEEPQRRAGLRATPLICIPSPYRRLLTPLLDFIDQLRQQREGMIGVIVPDLVEGRWWEYLLHTHRANVLRSLLLLKGNQRVAVISVPWYLERRRRSADAGQRERLGAHEVVDPELLAFDRRKET